MSQSTVDNTPTEKQLVYLRKLGYDGTVPATRKDASKLIEERAPPKANSSYTPRPTPVEEPSIVHEEATEEDLKYADILLKTAAKFHRLAVTAIKKRGEPLRGDIINAERNFLVKVEKLRSCNNG